MQQFDNLITWQSTAPDAATDAATDADVFWSYVAACYLHHTCRDDRALSGSLSELCVCIMNIECD